MTWPATMAAVAGAAVIGLGVPWAVMRLFVPSLASQPGVRNYRGRIASPGLGVVWFVWSGCALVGGLVALASDGDTVLPLLIPAGALALVAFGAGLVDDSYGDAVAKGFRGHLRALVTGRLTTGGLKLIVIGLASLAAALVLGAAAPWSAVVSEVETIGDLALYLVVVSIAGAAIALTSNLVNLTDLRPGRALKAYLILASFGIVGIATSALYEGAGVSGPLVVRAVDLVLLTVFAVGPAVAVWRYDLGEVGMLGDAGANPAGAVAGLLIVAGLPLWGLLAYAVFVFALNLASERVSFSRVIDGSPPLLWLDRLGRLDDGATAIHDDSARFAKEMSSAGASAEVESSEVDGVIDKGEIE